jgi:hypothetical protein
MTPLTELKVVVDHTLPPDELRVHPTMFEILGRALLEADTIRGLRAPDPNAPCGYCGRPADFHGPCGIGGCPLGADL